MIKSVRITDLHTIKQHSSKDDSIEENLWISTVDPEDRGVIKNIRQYFNDKNIPHHVEYFYDVDDDDLSENNKMKVEWIINAPNKEHVNRFIDFLLPYVKSKISYNLGVNCFAGVSRSTALGITAWVMQGISPQEALQNILDVRFCAWPNLRILRLSSEILNIDIYTPVKKWVTENKNKLVMPSNSWKY
jgi:predicted protein tyrosine phosphatase